MKAEKRVKAHRMGSIRVLRRDNNPRRSKRPYPRKGSRGDSACNMQGRRERFTRLVCSSQVCGAMRSRLRLTRTHTWETRYYSGKKIGKQTDRLRSRLYQYLRSRISCSKIHKKFSRDSESDSACGSGNQRDFSLKF